MNVLPSEIVLNILSYLPQKELLERITKVSKLWNQLVATTSLWRIVDIQKSDADVTDLYLQNIEMISTHVKSLTANEDFLSNINDEKPDWHFINLRDLDLSGSYMRSVEVIKQFLKKCTRLNFLAVRFDETVLLREIFPILLKLDLKHLKLNYCGDDTEFLFLLEELSRTQVCRSIDVLCNTIQNRTVHFLLSNFNCIKTLDVTSTYLKNDIFMSMTKMNFLTSLTVDYTRINDEGLRHIAPNAPNLKVFSMIKCQEITDLGLFHIASNCPLIEQVTICKSHSISGNSLKLLGNYCPLLKRLTIMACSQIDDSGVESCVMRCHNLRVLILNFCIDLTDKSLYAVSTHCPSLQRLDISHNGKFTSNGLCYVLKSCRWLTSLSCASCSAIDNLKFNIHNHCLNVNQRGMSKTLNTASEVTPIKQASTDISILNCTTSDTRVHQISTAFKHNHIRSVNLSHTSISAPAVLELSFFCPDLRNIYLFGCKNVTHEIVDKLFNNCVFMERICVDKKTYFKHNYINLIL